MNKLEPTPLNRAEPSLPNTRLGYTPTNGGVKRYLRGVYKTSLIKYISFEPIIYVINLYIASLFKVFNEFDFICYIECIDSLKF